jgi:hypothetical protein
MSEKPVKMFRFSSEINPGHKSLKNTRQGFPVAGPIFPGGRFPKEGGRLAGAEAT